MSPWLIVLFAVLAVPAGFLAFGLLTLGMMLVAAPFVMAWNVLVRLPYLTLRGRRHEWRLLVD